MQTVKTLCAIFVGTVTAAAFAVLLQACGGASGNSAYTDELPALKAEAEAAMSDAKLKALLVGITVGGETLLLSAEGESMSGVPATPDMHLRNGAVAIAYMGYLFYRLVDAGVVNADDPVGTWLPGLPNAQSVTLEMLLNGTACYRDFVPLETFLTQLYDDPFRQWTPQELIDLAFAEAPTCTPGEGWSYAHTNFVILGLVLEQATGKPLDVLIDTYLLSAFHMSETAAPGTAFLPEPVLHSYTAERGHDLNGTYIPGPYEDATFWDPSWTLARGAVQYSTVRDTLTGFRAIGRGAGLTDASFEAMLAPHTAGMAFWSADKYYAQGVIYDNGWIVQAPSFAGLYGAAAYNADKDITVAVWCTKTIESATDESNTAQALVTRLSEILVPDSPIQ